MKLQIENWLENSNELCGKTKELFEEAVMCYKVGAYKSAFIMSYLTFKVIIRNRILTCKYLPDNYTKDMWENIIVKDLRNDEKWETAVNEIVTATEGCKNKKDIIKFFNRESELQKYNYWREYRNSVAHAKEERFDSSTVEHFWNYAMDSLPKFYVLGGKEYLLKALFECYKYNNTISLEEINSLLVDVSILYKNEADSFFNNFFKELEENNVYEIISEDNKGFWSNILRNEHQVIRDGFIKSLFVAMKRFYSIYDFFPEIFQYIQPNKSKIIVENIIPYIGKLPCNQTKRFHRLLIDLLKYYNPDMNEALNNMSYKIDVLDLMGRIEFSKEELRELNEQHLIKNIILHAGEFYFRNSSQDHYEQFNNGKSYRVNCIEKCFEDVEWDSELIEKVTGATMGLRDSCSYRNNVYAGMNGYDRKISYNKVITNAKNRITDADMLNSFDEILKVLNEIK